MTDLYAWARKPILVWKGHTLIESTPTGWTFWIIPRRVSIHLRKKSQWLWGSWDITVDKWYILALGLPFMSIAVHRTKEEV